MNRFVAGIAAFVVGLHGMPKDAQRALYQPYILAMQLAALACLGVGTPIVLSTETFLLYMPAALLGVAVNAVLLVSGIALLGRGGV